MNFLDNKSNDYYEIKNDKLYYTLDGDFIDDVKAEVLPTLTTYEVSSKVKEYEPCVIVKHNNLIEKTVDVYLNDKRKLCSYNTKEFRKKGFSPFSEIDAMACDTGVLISIYDYKNQYYEYKTYNNVSFKSNSFTEVLLNVSDYNKSLGIKEKVVENHNEAPYTKMILDALNSDNQTM